MASADRDVGVKQERLKKESQRRGEGGGREIKRRKQKESREYLRLVAAFLPASSISVFVKTQNSSHYKLTADRIAAVQVCD